MNEVNDKKINFMNSIIVIILLIVIGGLVFYILYDKNIIFKSKVNSNDDKSNKVEVIEKPNTNIEEEKALDLNKCLNCSGSMSFKNTTKTSSDIGLSINTNQDKKSVTLSINWEKFGPVSEASQWANQTLNYQITGFTKEIKESFIGEFGQDSKGIIFLYLMSDGTVEYTRLFNQKIDNQNNSYYEMNYFHDNNGDYFQTSGAISSVSNVINLYNIDVTAGDFGYKSAIAATKDGSFYELGTILNNF